MGGKKGARGWKQFCWVLANHVDQQVEVGGLGTEPVEIGPGDGVILDSNTFMFWLSSKGYFFSLFCSSTQTSPSFLKSVGWGVPPARWKHRPGKSQQVPRKKEQTRSRPKRRCHTCQATQPGGNLALDSQKGVWESLENHKIKQCDVCGTCPHTELWHLPWSVLV